MDSHSCQESRDRYRAKRALCCSAGIHLRQLREDRKMTLGAVEALSEGLGQRINKSYLFRVERGLTLPSLPRLRVLAHVYRVKPARLHELIEAAFDEQENEAALRESGSDRNLEELIIEANDARSHGESSRAALLYREVVLRTKPDSNQPGCDKILATAYYGLAVAHVETGRWELAREYAERALESAATSWEVRNWLRLTLAQIYFNLHRRFLSAEILGGLLVEQEALPPELTARTHRLMGDIHYRSDPRRAAHHYRTALSAARLTKNPLFECESEYMVGVAEAACGNFSRSLKILLKALQLAKRKDFSLLLAKIHVDIGKNYFRRSDFTAARQWFREASRLARERDYTEQIFLSQYYLRELSLVEGDILGAKCVSASLKHFLKCLNGSLEEAEAFKNELSSGR